MFVIVVLGTSTCRVYCIFSRIVGLGYFAGNIFVVCSSEHVEWERDKHALHAEHKYEASGNDFSRIATKM